MNVISTSDEYTTIFFFREIGGIGDIEEITQAQEWYYEMSGWSPDSGNPTNDTLKRLGLEWIDL